MTEALRSFVDEASLAHYREHGFAVLRGVVPPELLARMQALIEPWVDASVASWRTDGVIAESFADLDFHHRYLAAWRAAGRPHFRRSPNHFLITPEMYAFIRSPELLTIAGALLGTDDISMHGIFNARPQLPDHRETQTPWHQDAQYWDLDYGDERDRERATHVVTLWLPLQPVDERSGALAVASLRDTKGALYPHEPSDFERTGFLKIPDAVMAALPVDAPRIGPGDALVFTQITPHGAWPNHADHIRWSVDIRYEATATATVVGRKYGFVAQDRSDPSRETSLDDWLAKRRPPSPEAPRPLAEVAPERGR